MFIFLEAFSDPFVTAVEAASQSSPGTKTKLYKVEATDEGLLLGESAEYTASQAHQTTPVPTTHTSFHHRQHKQCSDFFQRSYFLRLT
jgi:hypothetical protein